LHASKQWAKKIKQKLVYFGTDKEATIKKYRAEKDKWQAGINPWSNTPATPLGELVIEFLNSKRKLMESCDLLPRRHFLGAGDLGRVHAVFRHGQPGVQCPETTETCAVSAAPSHNFTVAIRRN
jgi:hypothetical protein